MIIPLIFLLIGIALVGLAWRWFLETITWRSASVTTVGRVRRLTPSYNPLTIEPVEQSPLKSQCVPLHLASVPQRYGHRV